MAAKLGILSPSLVTQSEALFVESALKKNLFFKNMADFAISLTSRTNMFFLRDRRLNKTGAWTKGFNGDCTRPEPLSDLNATKNPTCEASWCVGWPGAKLRG